MKYNDNGEWKDIIVKAVDTLPIGTIVEYDGTEVPDGYVEYNDKPKILWTNPNPTSSMDANTTITLSSSDYDIYEIIFNLYGGSSITYTSAKSIKGKSAVLIGAGYPSQGVSCFYRELVYENDTTFKAGNSRGITKSSEFNDNAKCIPLYIIGYKIGLFD